MMNDQEDNTWATNERECVHKGPNVQGSFYSGTNYIKALQRLSGSDAMKMAGKVGAFFWADAPKTRVWLCEACAAEIGL